MYRLFIAIDLPKPVKGRLEVLQKHLDGVKWIEQQQMHLTIRFLGNVDEYLYQKLLSNLKIIHSPSFVYSIKGVGVFPNVHRPKVLWAGVEADDRLSTLYQKIEKVVVSSGFDPEERDYKPHITLGRVKQRLHSEECQSFLEKYENLEITDIKVDNFILYQSRLTRHGALHQQVQQYSLS
jgi:2'-5' RNA ligase